MTKIYTKNGDNGTTKIGSLNYPKNNQIFDLLGTIDELNSFIGLVYHDSYLYSENKIILKNIIETLMNISSQIMYPSEEKINDINILYLEEYIDNWYDNISDEFIILFNTELASKVNICRTISRRAERELIRFLKNNSVDSNILKYLNRLSDFFFILSHRLDNQQYLSSQ